MSNKLRVAVFYGGRSGEHEISLQSAASVIRNLDRDRYDVIPVGIDKQGRWHLNDLSLMDLSAKALEMKQDSPEVVLPPYPECKELIPLSGKGGSAQPFDVIFPVMHGPLCEDGAIQGIFELSNIPYVGSGVLGSAVGMDKDVAKRLVREAGLPVGPFLSIRKGNWIRNQVEYLKKIENELGFPCFVKPANMGSSVGIHQVKKLEDLDSAIADAFQYDHKILIEKRIDAREIELAVLQRPGEDEVPQVSIPGEIAATDGFYSYSAKYIDEQGARLMIPAELTDREMKIAQKMSGEIFQLLECSGLSRVDLFLDRQTGEFLFNEINTLPGFTTISMYPKLWEASGIPYMELLTRLIDLALERHKRSSQLKRDWH